MILLSVVFAIAATIAALFVFYLVSTAIVITAAVAIIIATAIVIAEDVLFNVTEVLIDLFDIRIKNFNVLFEVGNRHSDLIETVNNCVEKLCFGLGIIEVHTLEKTFEVCGLFGNVHF